MSKEEQNGDCHKRQDGVNTTSDFFDGKWWKSGDNNGNGMANHYQNGGALKREVPQSPTDKVRVMLQACEKWESDNLGDIVNNQLFCQLDVLCTLRTGGQGWKEMTRWLKYEEKVETGNRWSKPHVATTSLRSLFSVREALSSGSAVVDLNMEIKNGHAHIAAMAGALTKMIAEKKNLAPKIKQQIYECLLKPHKHRDRKERNSTGFKGSSKDDDDLKPPSTGVPIRRASIYSTDYMAGGAMAEELMPHKPNKKLLKKIPKGTEAANILIGHCEFLTEPIIVFVRLSHAYVLADMTEVELPTRFIILALGPTRLRSLFEYEEIGRAVGGLLGDKVFCQVAYKAKTTEDLVNGMDEFLDGLTVLPPSVWDPATRLDPPEKTLSQDQLVQRLVAPHHKDTIKIHDSSHNDVTLQRTGKLFGGLVADIKRRYPLYLSDIKDSFSIQCIASIVFLYFACVTPIVTFGGLLGDGTNNYMGTMETLLSGSICGTTWALLSGQPLIIVGATGPMLIFETLLFSFSDDRGIDFLSFRFWIGMWVVLILVIFIVFDLSALVRYITRFTEESFAVLISFIFIYEAFKKTYGIWEKTPVNVTPERHLDCYCVPPDENSSSLLTTINPNLTVGEPSSFEDFSSLISKDCVNSFDQLIINHHCLEYDKCISGGWQTIGSGCDVFTYVQSVPDVFLLCVFLFLGTFFIAYKIRCFRETPYFPSVVRTNVSDFAVLFAILLMCGLDALFGLKTPKLNVPSELKTTRDDRDWIVNPMTLDPWYMIILALLPALLAVILIFLDQQITAVIVNRKEYKLQKGHGYHLDMAVLAVLIGVCSLAGLPWFVAATVRSITHVRSLIVQSETSAPGDRPEMLGVREQRVTGFIIHVLVGLSIFITGVLQYVPMAVLYGVFLYMGVTSLAGVQFVERIALLFMPQKYQPQHIYLRHVQTHRVHIFTLVQIFCMIIMWVVKSIPDIAIAFPIMVLAVCFVRKAMDMVFTQYELFWLDHLLPHVVRRREEDLGEDSDHDEDIDVADPESISYTNKVKVVMEESDEGETTRI